MTSWLRSEKTFSSSRHCSHRINTVRDNSVGALRSSGRGPSRTAEEYKMFLFLSSGTWILPSSIGLTQFSIFMQKKALTGSRQKVAPLKNFTNFSGTIKDLWHKFLHLSYPFNYSQIWKVSLHYLRNCQNYAAFSLSNLAVETYQKLFQLFKTVQTPYEYFLSRETLRMSSITFTYSVKLFLKPWTALLIRPGEIVPMCDF